MKKVIITGPTGVIGIALVELLISRQVQVTAVCRAGSKRIKNLPKSSYLKIVECNLNKLGSLLDKLSHDYDVFFHLGWESTFGDARNDVHTQMDNIKYTLEAVELAKVLGCKKFIGAGSQAEYGRCEGALSPTTPTNPENGYGAAKLCAGQLSRIRCEQLGLAHIWVRVLSVYGPGDGLNTLISSVICSFLANEKPHCTNGEQVWDYIYSEDAAKAFLAIAQSGINGKVYCLGSGEAEPLKNYILCIRDVINPKAEIGFGDISYSEQQIMYLCADISELIKDTGFIPEMQFKDGIVETVKWIRENM